MPTIRPVSDLRNHFAEITREAQGSKEPVFLTKNGVGSLVVMSMDAYEEWNYENEVYEKGSRDRSSQHDEAPNS